MKVFLRRDISQAKENFYGDNFCQYAFTSSIIKQTF